MNKVSKVVNGSRVTTRKRRRYLLKLEQSKSRTKERK